MRTAVAQRDSLQQRLDGEQRAVKEAREEMERQQVGRCGQPQYSEGGRGGVPSMPCVGRGINGSEEGACTKRLPNVADP